MADAPAPRSAAGIRVHFIVRLNLALLRAGMYGGEPALGIFMDDLAWIDGRDERVADVMKAWGTWSPVGVRGWLARLFGDLPSRHDAAAAFTYADLAQHWGYLRPQRTLTAKKYTRLRGEARGWTAAGAHIPADVVAAFGPPSLGLTKYNRLYPVSLAYASAAAGDPLVIFDFWQITDWDTRPSTPRLGPEPVLRDVRWRESGSTVFTFTPVGETLRADQQV
jgi:hypothetical protein